MPTCMDMLENMWQMFHRTFGGIKHNFWIITEFIMQFPVSISFLPFLDNRRKHDQFLFKPAQTKYGRVDFVKTKF